jgi:NitT/TauT family transport system substrate-binding protein
MKRFVALLVAFLMLTLVFWGCSSEEASGTSSSEVEKTESSEAVEESMTDEKVKVRIAGMKGPTSIGLVEILEKNANGQANNEYEFTLAGAADEITPLLIQGKLDIAAVPANLASVLYNKTEGKIKLLAVNNLGVLYIVAKGEGVSSVVDLKGKTVYATGKGTTPEYTLRNILSKNGIDPDNDLTIEFKSEATEVVAAIAGEENAIAMLPQPYVTVACNKVQGLNIALDLNDEWQKVSEGSSIVTGVIVVRDEFANSNPEAVKKFLYEYRDSINAVNADSAAAAKLVVKHGIFDNEGVIAKAIPACNITYVAGADLKAPVSAYLGVLFEQNPQSVGGKLPNDDFYYVAE